MYVAAGIESPAPVIKAIYPARQTGHFGMITNANTGMAIFI